MLHLLRRWLRRTADPIPCHHREGCTSPKWCSQTGACMGTGWRRR